MSPFWRGFALGTIGAWLLAGALTYWAGLDQEGLVAVALEARGLAEVVTAVAIMLPVLVYALLRGR